MFILLCIADMARTQSTRSENGHAFWQREARLRSVQTACADYDDVSAVVYLHQCRLAELSREITSNPMKKRKEETSKNAETSKITSSEQPNKYASKNKLKFRRGNPYNVFVSEPATGAKGKGGVIFVGLADEYRARRDTLASQKLRIKSDAMAMQQAGTNVPIRAGTLIAPSASLACEVQNSRGMIGSHSDASLHVCELGVGHGTRAIRYYSRLVSLRIIKFSLLHQCTLVSLCSTTQISWNKTLVHEFINRLSLMRLLIKIDKWSAPHRSFAGRSAQTEWKYGPR